MPPARDRELERGCPCDGPTETTSDIDPRRATGADPFPDRGNDSNVASSDLAPPPASLFQVESPRSTPCGLDWP